MHAHRPPDSKSGIIVEEHRKTPLQALTPATQVSETNREAVIQSYSRTYSQTVIQWSYSRTRSTDEN
eukprot:4860201-Pyramimonas_sp.AAC.1